ncbi:unnamed protein product [Pipistrellus nathusii]|uniref:Uncharacterized protein n=1 Tax=Pipistrellus nathusii TaxID=59473 RepID=A0ABN9Z7F4_PIPNA
MPRTAMTKSKLARRVMQPSQWAMPALSSDRPSRPSPLSLSLLPEPHRIATTAKNPMVSHSEAPNTSRLEPARPHPGNNNYLHVLYFSCTFAWIPPSSSGKAG